MEVIPGNYPCSRCETIKPHTEFYKHNEKANGLASACKACENEARAATYRNMSEDEKAARYKLQWEQKKSRMAADPEVRSRILSQKRRTKKAYTIRKPWMVRAQKMNARARELGAIGNVTGTEVKALLDGGCSRCGTSDELQIDHVKSMVIGGTNTIDNLQTLCKPCHLLKTHSSMTDFRIK